MAIMKCVLRWCTFRLKILHRQALPQSLKLHIIPLLPGNYAIHGYWVK